MVKISLVCQGQFDLGGILRWDLNFYFMKCLLYCSAVAASPTFLGGCPVLQVASTNGMVSEFELPLEMVLFDDKDLLESECMGHHYAWNRIPLAGFLSHLACGHNALGISAT